TRCALTAAADGCETVERTVDAPASGESLTVSLDLVRWRGRLPTDSRDALYPGELKLAVSSRTGVLTVGPDEAPVSVPFELHDPEEHVIPDARFVALAADRVLSITGRTPLGDAVLV